MIGILNILSGNLALNQTQESYKIRYRRMFILSHFQPEFEIATVE